MLRLSLQLLSFSLLGIFPAASSEPLPLHPAAVVATRDGGAVLVADASRGRLFRIDIASRQVTRQTKPGESLVDLAMIGNQRLIAADGQLNELIYGQEDAAGFS